MDLVSCTFVFSLISITNVENIQTCERQATTRHILHKSCTGTRCEKTLNKYVRSFCSGTVFVEYKITKMAAVGKFS